MLKISGAVVTAALLALMAGVSANAATNVTYSTSGQFSDTSLSGAIDFTGVGSTAVVAPTQITLGTFDVSPTAQKAAPGAQTTFSVDVTQTNPLANPPTAQVTSDKITGAVNKNNSSIDIKFGDQGFGTFTVGSVTYDAFYISNVEYGIVDSISLDAKQTLPASFTLYGYVFGPSAATPEPASMILFGTVLAGVGLIARRRLAL